MTPSPSPSPSPSRSRWFWLPALVTALFVSPLVSVALLYLLGAVPYLALAVGVAACAALTWSVARWQLAGPRQASALAVVAGAVAFLIQTATWAGVS